MKIIIDILLALFLLLGVLVYSAVALKLYRYYKADARKRKQREEDKSL